MTENNRLEHTQVTLSSVTPEEWQRLRERRVFFGHQSVGENLVSGLRALLEDNPAVGLKIVRTSDPQSMREAGFYHGPIGTNTAPSTKLSEFERIVSAGIADSGVAMVKLCYVDINAQTDAEALFVEYRHTVDSLRKRFPCLTVLHITLPLQFDLGTMFHWRTILRRKQTSYRILNAIRQQYNDLLRTTYGGCAPIFDLARLESTRPDGTRGVVRYHGAPVDFLVQDWTTDGGHLNTSGQRVIAEALLATLAKL